MQAATPLMCCLTLGGVRCCPISLVSLSISYYIVVNKYDNVGGNAVVATDFIVI